MKPENTRLTTLVSYCAAYNGKKISDKLTPEELGQVVEFIKAHDHLLHLEFEYAANRWFLNEREKPKHLGYMIEMVIGINAVYDHERRKRLRAAGAIS